MRYSIFLLFLLMNIFACKNQNDLSSDSLGEDTMDQMSVLSSPYTPDYIESQGFRISSKDTILASKSGIKIMIDENSFETEDGTPLGNDPKA